MLPVFKAYGLEFVPPPPLSLRCPHCQQMGVFETLGTAKDYHPGHHNVALGHRRCPNPACIGHVFIVWDILNVRVIATYPPEVIEFNAASIPDPIVGAFKEALVCHAHQCYVAAAIMVRKTLELLCDDQNAAGSNLKERVKDLGTKIVLPKALLDGLDSLRLLGNDAAHVKAAVFGQIGQDELDAAIELTKEVLKALYQYQDLLQKIEALKAPKQAGP